MLILNSSEMDCINEINLMWTGAAIMVLVAIHNYYEYKRLATAKTTPFKLLPMPLLQVLVGVFMGIASPFILMYYLAVTFILSLKYGNKFGGLLRGKDAIFAFYDGCVCYVVCVVEYDAKSNSKTFYEFAEETMREALLKKSKEDAKSYGTVEKGFGYLYLLKEQVTFEECFNKLKTVDTSTGEITKGDLLRLIGEYHDKPLPKNNKGFWQISVGTQPIRWTEGNESDCKTCYPVVVKAQHSLADGVHLFHNILALFADHVNPEQGTSPHSGRIKEDNQLVKFYYKTQTYLQNILGRVAHFIQLVYAMPLPLATLYFNLVLMTKDPNLLDARPLTQEKLMYFNAEESPHYIQTVKRIKRKIPNCSFEDVFLTAFTASFSDYFRKHATRIPDYVVAEMPAAVEAVALLSLNPNETKDAKMSCKNTLSVHLRKLPIGIACGDTKPNLLDALEFIKKERILLARCAERQVNSWVLHSAVTYLPESFLQLMFNHAKDPDVAISNVPGPERITIGGGRLLKDVVVFPGHRRGTGVCAVILAYDNRIKLSLVVDKTIIKTEEEVKNIVDNVYKYIDLLDSEI